MKKEVVFMDSVEHSKVNSLLIHRFLKSDPSDYHPLNSIYPDTQMVQESLMKSNNSVIILDKHAKIIWINNGFTKLSGYSLYECIGVSWQAIRKNNDFKRVVIDAKENMTCEYKNHTFEKRVYWTQSSITPILNTNGELEQIFIIETDITHLKQQEEAFFYFRKTEEQKSKKMLTKLLAEKKELERCAKTKELFFAQMSHEIRTPLNSIIGLLEVLSKTHLMDEQKKYLAAMKMSGDALLIIINDILDFSKIDAGKMVLQENPFYVAKNISSLIDIFSPKAIEKNISLEYEIDINVPEILKGDSYRINQILMNLISNAIKFTSDGGVKLSVRVKEKIGDISKLEFCVSDTGSGIPESKLSSLFFAFYQAHELPGKYNGTGLGLSISKKLIELQGGTITVQSQENRGSSFTVYLPLKKCSDAEIEKLNEQNDKEDSLSTTKELAGLKVLIVDDNPVNQLLGEKQLSDLGVESDTATNGKIAIEKLRKKQYDLILMDIKMPEMDGYETTQYIRTKMKHPVCNIPIIALTAYSGTSDAFKCLKNGMNDYLVKPFNTNDLYKKIKKLVNLRKDK